MVDPGVTLETLLGGADPHALIESSLRETVLDVAHQHTKKFLVDGHPDVLVRLNAVPPEDILAAADAIQAMPEEVLTLPYLPVVHEGEGYVFTQLVKGQKFLNALLAGKTTPEDAENIWAGLGTYILNSFGENTPVGIDIEGVAQYMHGSVSTDTDGIDKTRLVDLSHRSHTFGDRPDLFGMSTLFLSHAVLDIEGASEGHRLVRARSIVADLIAEAYRLPDAVFDAEAAEASLRENRQFDSAADEGLEDF